MIKDKELASAVRGSSRRLTSAGVAAAVPSRALQSFARQQSCPKPIAAVSLANVPLSTTKPFLLVATFLLCINTLGGQWQLKDKTSMAIHEAEATAGDYPVLKTNASGGAAIFLKGAKQKPWVQDFTVDGSRPAELWVRVWFDHGAADSFFSRIDNGKKRTISASKYHRWLWLRLASGIKPGKHKLELSPRESARIDCLALYCGKDFAQEPLYAEKYPVVLPLGIPNELTAENAPTSGIWSAYGPGANSAKADLSGPDLDGRGYSNRLVCPKKGSVYLMPNNSDGLALSADLLPSEYPKWLKVPFHASAQFKIKAVLAVGDKRHVAIDGQTKLKNGNLMFDLRDPETGKVLVPPLRVAGLLLEPQQPGLQFAWGHPVFCGTRKVKGLAGGAYQFPDAGYFSGKRSDVAKDYGSKYRVTVNGNDVAGLEHAATVNLPPLQVVGMDLSDQAGWPNVDVQPGLLAIDPETKRIKVHPTEKRPLAFLGLARSGFGVPGNGRVAVHDGFCYVPAGEGDLQIIDVRNPQKPRAATIVESYYFWHDCAVFRDFLLFSARGKLVALSNIRDPFHPGSLTALGGDHGHLRGVVSGGKFVVLSTKEGLLLAKFRDLSEGFCYVGKPIPGTGMPAGKILWNLQQTGKGPEAKGVLYAWELTHPVNPKKLAHANVAKHETDKEFVFERLLNCGEDWAVTGYGSKLSVYRRNAKTVRKQCWLDVADTVKGPIRIRDAAVMGDYLIVLDGRQEPGQHSLNSKSPPSRLLVYDLNSALASDDIEAMIDPEGGEVTPQIHKVAAVFVDKQPSEFSNLTMVGNLAYVNDYDYGLVIFDLKKPLKPTLLSRTVGCGEGRIGGYVNDNVAYVVQTFGGSVIASDVSDPLNPKVLGNYWDGEWCEYWSRIAGRGRIVYLARDYSVKIVDFSDPAKPVKVGVFRDRQNKPIAGGNPLVWGKTCCIATNSQDPENGLYLFYDVSDAKTPKLIADLAVKGKGGGIIQLCQRGGVLVSIDATRMVTLDIRNPAKPGVLGILTVAEMQKKDPNARFDVYQGNAEGICLIGNYAYTSYCNKGVTKTGFCQFDLADPAQPKFIKVFDPQPKPFWTDWPDFYGDCISYGPYLIGGNYGQIELFDASDPSDPKFMSTKLKGYQWSCGTAYRGRLYVPSLAGIAIYRLPVPDQLGGNPKMEKVGN